MEIEVRTLLPTDAREELDEELRRLGYEPKGGERWEFREAVGALEILLWVADNIGAPAALAIGAAVSRWAWRRFRGKARGGSVRVIWGPDDEILTVVKIEEPEPDPKRKR